jgi:hypothetical protein
MTKKDPQRLAAELGKLQADLKTYRRDYNEYSNDKSITLKEKTPILANFAKLISSTLDRIKVLEERLSESSAVSKAAHSKQRSKSANSSVSTNATKTKEKQVNKERQLEKKSIEPETIPEKALPPETKDTTVPVTTGKIVVADKVILVIKVDFTKINYFGNSGEINWRIVFDRFPGTATMEFNKIFAGSGLKFPIQM